ncbi:MAG: hypothetical protein HW416_3790 [Chloroflexi bacterium]|nr:hypothetical protein [Chloroflexota bacterium]
MNDQQDPIPGGAFGRFVEACRTYSADHTYFNYAGPHFKRLREDGTQLAAAQDAPVASHDQEREVLAPAHDDVGFRGSEDLAHRLNAHQGTGHGDDYPPLETIGRMLRCSS